MNVFKRMGDIMSANMNSALDKLEDPEKMINLMIGNLEETMDTARGNLAAHKANRTTLTREKVGLAACASRWNERAAMAVGEGRDDLAREALVEKRSANEKLASVDRQIKTLDDIIAGEQIQIAEIHDKLIEVTDKKAALVERARAAKRKKKAEVVLKKTEGFDITRKFAEMEAKIERMEAEADTTRYKGHRPTTEEAFSKMESDAEIEGELAELKRRKTEAGKN